MNNFHLGIMFADGSIIETFEKSFFLIVLLKKLKVNMVINQFNL